MGVGDHAAPAGLSELPAVHELAAALQAPHALAVAAARRAIDERRAQVLAGETPQTDVLTRARELLAALDQPSLRQVINATGVIVHTNLGRAPLPASARDAVARAAEGYSNLELDLATGERGSRHAHVEGLLTELTGADAALVVNNGAAAVLLAAAALAGAGRAIVVSRGQLVEIGGGFRIPEVIAQSGARMVEVGTTNRTRLEDYEQAVARNGDQLGAVLRVHPSNFRSVGFVQDVSVEELCGLGVPVIDDVGSGVLAGAAGIPALADEPALTQSIAAGAALVCCSGDKLLGGPQAGLLVGRAEAVAAARRHPLARALRIDKLSLAALEATLMLYRDPQRARDEIPVLSHARLRRAGAVRQSASAGGCDRRRDGDRQVDRKGGRRGAAAARARGSRGRPARRGTTGGDHARAARRRPAGDRTDPRRRGAAGPPHAGRLADRGHRRGGPQWRCDQSRRDELRSPDARDRGPHRSRQDRADPGADRRRHRSPAGGASPRDLDRARLCRAGTSVGPPALGDRRSRPRAVRADDGRRGDGDRPVPDDGRRRRRRHAPDARACGRAAGARGEDGRDRRDQERPRRSRDRDPRGIRAAARRGGGGGIGAHGRRARRAARGA